MRLVLLACGAIGFFLGMARYPDWQDAVEPAQVLAGLVQYPAGNPVYEYSIRTWTVAHQALGALLYLGATERALSLIMSGVLGMLAFQALGLVVFALSRDLLLSILSPVLIYFVDGASGGVTYPIFLMGTIFTYGSLGLSFMLLTLASFGAGQPRAGAVLLGFGPAVHASVGVWSIVLVTIALALDAKGRAVARQALPYFVAGLAGAVVSAAVQMLATGAFFAPAATTGDVYFLAFVRHWDTHRVPFSLFTTDVELVALVTAIAVFWLGPLRRTLPEHAEILLRALVAATVLGGVLSVAYWLPPESVPTLLLQLMPSRLLNLSLMAGMAMVIALVARYRSNRMARAARGVMLIASAMILVVVLTGTARDVWRYGFPLPEIGDPELAAAADRSGMILTAANLHHIQLHTRRPVLLDGGALDAIIYTPGAAAETARILLRVYGVDLLDPGPEVSATRPGALLEGTGKQLWEARHPDEWRAIREEFGVVDVVTPGSWNLQLPIISRGESLALYEIPRD